MKVRPRDLLEDCSIRVSDANAMNSAADINANTEVGVHTCASLQRESAPRRSRLLLRATPVQELRSNSQATRVARSPPLPRQVFLDDTKTGAAFQNRAVKDCRP